MIWNAQKSNSEKNIRECVCVNEFEKFKRLYVRNYSADRIEI